MLSLIHGNCSKRNTETKKNKKKWEDNSPGLLRGSDGRH